MRADTIFAEDTEIEDDGSIWLIDPVTIHEFVQEYIRLSGLSEAQADVLGAIFPANPADGEQIFQVEQAILRVGQGGGKNYTTTIAVVYAIYLWCCLKDPHRFFDLEYHEPFDILNFSQVNEQQARNVFFRTLSNVMRRTIVPNTSENWFSKHMGFKIADYGRKDIKDKEMTIPNRNRDRGGIRIYCLDSTAKSVEGYTIWMYILDEPSRANTPAKYGTAKRQYETAHTNATTRFEPHQYLGCMFAYPEQEVNDLLIETFERYAVNPQENHHEVGDNVLTAWYATYVFNPKKEKNTYLKAFKHDPVDADRRWRAIVPPNEFGFFMPHMNKIEDCANPDIVKPVEWRPTITRRTGSVKGKKQEIDFTAIELLAVNKDDRQRRWGGDFAVSRDSLVLVGGYMRNTDKDIPDYVYTERTKEGTETEKRVEIGAMPVIDTILIWQPHKGKPVDYANVEETILRLLGDSFPNSRSLHFDKYNTESIKQKLLDLGIYDCDTLTFTNPQQLDYGRLTRHLVWNNAIEYPNNPTLMREMKRLLLINNAKLDHPDGAKESKDVWDALIICVKLLVEHSFDGGALDIDMGETIGMADEDRAEIELYGKAYEQFINQHHREPKNNKEMADYIKREFRIDKTASQIEYMKQSWLVDHEAMEAKIPGLGDGGMLDMGDDYDPPLVAQNIDEIDF